MHRWKQQFDALMEVLKAISYHSLYIRISNLYQWNDLWTHFQKYGRWFVTFLAYTYKTCTGENDPLMHWKYWKWFVTFFIYTYQTCTTGNGTLIHWGTHKLSHILHKYMSGCTSIQMILWRISESQCWCIKAD